MPTESPAPLATTGSKEPSQRTLALVFVVAGLLGMVMAATLLVEKLELLKNPDYVPTCSLNPVLSCGSVMTTPQAAAFGIPNPMLGIAGFSGVLVIGLALLAGAKFARWFWIMTQLGITAAVIFVHWLIVQSLYVIGALCPYCMVVWVVTIALFVGITGYSAQAIANHRLPSFRNAVHTARGYSVAIATAWCLVIVVCIAIRFFDYWASLFA